MALPWLLQGHVNDPATKFLGFLPYWQNKKLKQSFSATYQFSLLQFTLSIPCWWLHSSTHCFVCQLLLKLAIPFLLAKIHGASFLVSVGLLAHNIKEGIIRLLM